MAQQCKWHPDPAAVRCPKQAEPSKSFCIIHQFEVDVLSKPKFLRQAHRGPYKKKEGGHVHGS